MLSPSTRGENQCVPSAPVHEIQFSVGVYVRIWYIVLRKEKAAAGLTVQFPFPPLEEPVVRNQRRRREPGLRQIRRRSIVVPLRLFVVHAAVDSIRIRFADILAPKFALGLYVVSVICVQARAVVQGKSAGL